jgi:hypothetical protein
MIYSYRRRIQVARDIAAGDDVGRKMNEKVCDYG